MSLGYLRRQLLTSTFFLPMMSLGRRQRQAIYRVYDFCRIVDDIADGTLPKSEKLLQLDWWESEITRLYKSTPYHPVTKQLLSPVQHYRLGPDHFRGILAGMRMDAMETMILPTEQELEHYCYRVAGCVGLISVRIFGCRKPESEQFAWHLGQALQLTNILRDVKADAQMGRIYLPKEWMEHAGLLPIAPSDIPHRIAELKPVLQRLARKAAKAYSEAEKCVHPDDRESLRCALLMSDMYRRLFIRMQEDDWSYRKPYRMSVGDIGFIVWRLMNNRVSAPLTASPAQ